MARDLQDGSKIQALAAAVALVIIVVAGSILIIWLVFR